MFHRNLGDVVTGLVQLGFKLTGGNYARDELVARVQSGWLTFHADVDSDKSQACSGTQSAGLWKTILRSDNRQERVCDLPLEILQEAETPSDEAQNVVPLLAQLVEWVSATQRGELPAGWQSPPRDELEASVPDLALTLEVGPFARQGRLTCDETRLSVSFPMIPAIPNDLSAPRRACLDQLLEDLQSRVRMVRLIETETLADGRSVTAQIDLAGAPRPVLRRLLRISIDALRYVVSQNLATVELFANPAVTSTVWEVPSAQEQPAKGVEK